MSVDTTCYPLLQEKESGAGEMKCYKRSPAFASDSSITTMIATEIVNDILDNALEIATAKGLKLPSPKVVEKISPNVVGDILENILSTSSDASTNRQDETVLLDDEIKQIIKEMKYPSDNQKNLICTKGVGDQLGDRSDLTTDQVVVEPKKGATLERKNRLTNLVRNSKQMLAKFVTATDSDAKTVKSQDKFEQIVKVVNLEGNSSDSNVLNFQGQASEDRPYFPLESTMESVDLKTEQIGEGTFENSKGDDKLDEIVIDPTKIANLEEKQVEATKKKLGLGARIMKIFKKHPKHQDQVHEQVMRD